MLMTEWGKEQSTTKGNTTEYNNIENKDKWKSKFTGDNSESSRKKTTFQTLTTIFLFSRQKIFDMNICL